MVLVLEVILVLAILYLAFTIRKTGGNLKLTINVNRIEESVQRVETQIEDLSKHYAAKMSEEEKEYYEQSTSVIKALNEILAGNFPEEEAKE